MIVHRRRDNTHLLVVEWKKNATDPVLKCLEERIESLVANEDMHPGYRYQLGVLANSSNNDVRWRAFDRDGPISDWQYTGCS